MKAILWFLAVGTAMAFVYFFFIPYIKKVWCLWRVERTIKRMAKKYDGELADQLNEIADGAREIRKNSEMGDYLKEDK